MNQHFDVLIFDEADQAGYDCYKDAVEKLLWDEECEFAPNTKIFTHQSEFKMNIIGMDQIGAANSKVIIDNTPLPKDGAFSNYIVTAQTTVHTEYIMMYNIKSLAIYSGLACLLMFTVLLGQCYLICKLRKDTVSKREKLRDQYGYLLGETDKEKDS